MVPIREFNGPSGRTIDSLGTAEKLLLLYHMIGVEKFVRL